MVLILNRNNIFSIRDIIEIPLKSLEEILNQISAVSEDKSGRRSDFKSTILNDLKGYIQNLPKFEMSLRIATLPSKNNNKKELYNIALSRKDESNEEIKPTKLQKDCEYELEITITVRNGLSSNKKINTNYNNKFSKYSSNHSWWAILGSREKNELLALKRVGSIHNSMTIILEFVTSPEECIDHISFYLLSDSICGCDYIYDFSIQT